MNHSEPRSPTTTTDSSVKSAVMRVMVVDDHPSMARGVELSLGRADDIEVVGVLHKPRDVFDRVMELLPDVILMDVRMPRREGIDLLIKIRSAMPQVKVIMLSASEDPQDIRDAMRMGAYGYLSKGIPWSLLIPVVRMAREDQVVISRTALDPVLGNVSSADSPLTDEEIEVLRLLVEFDSLGELAKRVSMARSTLTRTLERIQSKLGAKTRPEAVAIAARNGLL